MKAASYLITILILSANSVFCQNSLDENGLRTGKWKGFYDNGTVRYEAEFINGKPIGITKRFDPGGNLAVTLNYYGQSGRCMATMYAVNGEVQAKGVYENQQKDSVWQYFGADGKLRMKETYSMGILDGESIYYYHTGNVSQEIRYISGNKHGPWLKFFENGDTMLVAYYNENELDGKYNTYFQDGNKQISGMYDSDLKDGNWIYFSEDGDTLWNLSYNKGNVMNRDVLEKSYEDFIKSIEENEGNMPDPASEGWQ